MAANSTSGAGTSQNTGSSDSRLNRLSGATSDFIADARESVSGAVSSVIDTVKAHPKAAAAIAAGATAAVAGAAYGATKLGQSNASSSGKQNASNAKKAGK